MRRLLEHPLTRGLNLDDPRTTHLRRRIVAEKPLLRAVYRDWYRGLAAALPPPPGAVLELGAGAGFFAKEVPGLLGSEVFFCPWVDLVLDGLALPFAAGSLRGVVMTNVLHHLPAPSRFLDQAAAAVRPGGVVAMVEPWNTRWSRFVYRRLHHEPFEPEAASWEVAGGGPLTRANGALPWILFRRDRRRLAERHPEWEVVAVEPMMPVRYLVSGGISLRSLSPAFSLPLWRGVEVLLHPLRQHLAMFARVVLRRRAT